MDNYLTTHLIIPLATYFIACLAINLQLHTITVYRNTARLTRSNLLKCFAIAQ